MTFNYVIQSGDNSTDLEYKSTSSLSTNGGTIKDSANNSASLTLPTPSAEGSLGFHKDLQIIPKWSQQAYIKAANNGELNTQLFGSSVAIDDNTLVVGASNGGSAFVYIRDGSTWTQQAKLTGCCELDSQSAIASSFFGESVAISGDTIAIGASISSISE